MKYYHNLIPKKQSISAGLVKHSTDEGGGFNAELESAIAQELNNDAIVAFAQQIDSDYEESLSKLVGWSEISSPLIPDERVSWYYSQFQSLFHLTHMVFASVVSSKYKKMEANLNVFPSKRGRASQANNSTLPGDTNAPESVAILRKMKGWL